MSKPIQKVITQQFLNDAQDWVLTPGSDYVAGGWFRRHALPEDTRRPNPPARSITGSLRATMRKGSPSSVESYWELTKTWEEMGVPKGSIISSVSLDYNYRWQCQANSKHKASANDASFSGPDLAVGPVTIRNSGGTSLGTISTRKVSKDRTPSEGDAWKCDPDGVNNGSGIVDTNGWYTSTGTPVAIAHPNATSNKQVKLRIGLLHPSLPIVVPGNNYWVRNKIDKVVITIQHSQGTSFLMM